MTKVLYKSESFILGKCQCGCNEDISIRNTRGFLGRFKIRHSLRGSSNPIWKGGRLITSHGYVKILKPDHPLADPYGYVPEHRLVMEKHIGRYLGPREAVHHINENKQDNRIENLKLMTWSEHSSHHNFIDMSDRICTKCGIIDLPRYRGNKSLWRHSSNGSLICDKCYQYERYHRIHSKT